MKKFESFPEVLEYFINAQKQIIKYIGNHTDRDVHLYTLRKFNEMKEVLEKDGLWFENQSNDEQINIYR